MSYWEIFTWLTVIILGLGSIMVFLLFVREIKIILKKFRED